jgi:hypothetical protein
MCGLGLVAAIEFLHTEVGLAHRRHCNTKLRNLVWFAGPKNFKGDVNELQKRAIANLPPQQARWSGCCCRRIAYWRNSPLGPAAAHAQSRSRHRLRSRSVHGRRAFYAICNSSPSTEVAGRLRQIASNFVAGAKRAQPTVWGCYLRPNGTP